MLRQQRRLKRFADSTQFLFKPFRRDGFQPLILPVGTVSPNQRIIPRVDWAKKSLNTASSACVSARRRMSALASSNGMPRW